MITTRPLIGITCSTMDEQEGKGVRRFHVPEPYVRRVEEAGGIPLILPVTDPRRAREALALVHGLLLIGGDDVDPALYGAAPHPDLGPIDRSRDDFEAALARAAVDDLVPTLGVCRGVQLMNVAYGGTLHQHIPANVPRALAHAGRYDAAHAVRLVPGTRLHAILSTDEISVNSHHHQAIDRPAARLVVAATARDGVVEAAEDPSHPFLVGVQWHPERMEAADSTRRLFAAFIAAALKAARKDDQAALVR